MDEVRKKLIRNLIVIVGIFILVAIILLIYQGCGNKKLSYSGIEDKLKTASEEYFKKNNLLPTEEGSTAIVSSEVLISNNYMKKFEEMTDDTNCFGQVIVQKNGEKYNYIPYLICNNYRTKTFKSEIDSKKVESGDGVYLIDNEYIYRGEKVDNYLSFAGRTWRIVKVTEDGYLKLISENEEEDELYWDNRYNIDTDNYDGINNFEKSRIREKLTKIYGNTKYFGSSDKKKMVSVPICVGKRSRTNLSLNTNEECTDKLYGDYIDLIGMTDVAKASIDSNCDSLRNKSCSNYNYFRSFFKGSWTLIGTKDDSSKVYYVSLASLSAVVAEEEKNMHLVIYINSNEAIKSGDGSKDKPYTV